jgi:hypothetical protein
MPSNVRVPVQIAQPVLVRAEPILGRESEQSYCSSLLVEPIGEYDVNARARTAFSSEQDILECLTSIEFLLFTARYNDFRAVDRLLKMLLEMEEHDLCEYKYCLLPLLLECMVRFPYRTSLQKHCLSLLYTIPKDHCHECIRLVLAAMRNHTLSDHVQWYGCLLCESWMSTGVFGAFCAEGGMESVMSAADAVSEEESGDMRQQVCRSIFCQLDKISKEDKHASDHYQYDYGLYRSLVRFRLSNYDWEGTPPSITTVEVQGIFECRRQTTFCKTIFCKQSLVLENDDPFLFTKTPSVLYPMCCFYLKYSMELLKF